VRYKPSNPFAGGMLETVMGEIVLFNPFHTNMAK
jgi:hypothetical protein